MLHSILLLLAINFIVLFEITAQITPAQTIKKNLVPNPSFEDLKEQPDDFGEVMHARSWEKLFHTPDLFSVDAFSPKVKIPYNFYGKQEASEGKAYIGVLAYHENSPNEFIGTKLIEPLKKGEKYEISMKVSLGEMYSNFVCNNLGILFANELKDFHDAGMAHLKSTSVITNSTGWLTLNKTIIADDNYKYLIIGNFFTKKQTKADRIRKAGYEGAYYYIDEVQVTPLISEDNEANFMKITGRVYDALTNKGLEARVDFVLGEINYRVYEDASKDGKYEFSHLQHSSFFYLEAKAKGYFTTRVLMEAKPTDKKFEKDFVLQPASIGSSIVLEHLHFDYGKATLQKKSIPELNSLIDFLQTHPNYHIEISGHTDNIGDAKANKELSLRRAEAVVNYVVEHGFVKKNRMIFIGLGEEKPIADNGNEEGRTKNRRVELKIVKD
ncbi:MAG: OmpA family protein [Bacteroidetes bacterium]|nr:MAG: OmpA family protein [Bacteroidota bacterium]TAG87732.1 MAG: OmpA family protein [Bacteroidota bacterium]